METKIWVISKYVHGHGGSLLLGPVREHSKEIHKTSELTGDMQSLVPVTQISLSFSKRPWDPTTWTGLSFLHNPQPQGSMLSKQGSCPSSHSSSYSSSKVSCTGLGAPGSIQCVIVGLFPGHISVCLLPMSWLQRQTFQVPGSVLPCI